MAAPQAAGTPAAGNPSAPTAVTAGTHGLDAILGDLSGDVEPVEGDVDAALGELVDAATGAEPQTEPDGEAEPDPKAPDHPARANDEEIFSDEALATVDGVKTARERVKELRRLNYEKYLELKKFNSRVLKRHEKLRHQIERHVSDKRTHDLLLSNVRANLQGLHSGDPDAIITALGNLTGQDGFKAFEQLTSRLINRGKPQLDPQVQAILDAQRAEIEQLKTGLTQRAETERAQQVEARIAQHKASIQQQVLASTTTPHLARIMRDDPERLTEVIASEIIKRNGEVSPQQLFESMEQEIREHLGEKPGAAPKGDGGSGSPAPKQQPSIAVQRSPGQSVGPRTAAASTRRQPDEDEALRDLANDPAFLSQFGL